MKVLPISYKETYPWLKHKHYAKRIPCITNAFGLFDDKKLIGVCTFGMPPMSSTDWICEGLKMTDVLELNRLCVNDGLQKNSLSFFVSQCLKKLNGNIIILSYADSNVNHCGYIYQATNWKYTGLASDGIKEYILNGKNIHSRHMKKHEFFEPNNYPFDDNLSVDDNFRKIGGIINKCKPKHRYLYLIGDKKFKKQTYKKLKLMFYPYPKEQNVKYDTSFQPETQTVLF